MQAEPLMRWSEPLFHYVEFAAAFLSTGAVGFRFSSLRGSRVDTDVQVYADAARRAAAIGLVGMMLGAGLLARSLPANAARRHTTVTALITGNLMTAASIALAVLALVGFVLALRRVGIGWWLAAVGVIGGQLRGVLSGRLKGLVNPMHVLAGGLWIGTLFVLAVAGLAMVLNDEPSKARRGAIVADMVHRFSPLALACGPVLVLFGVITAWNHLGHVSDLWTTPYGYALIVKLALVAMVFGLGAWNWRRVRPTLGTDEAALVIRRSARYELTFAALVLLVTGVLVSLPAPGEDQGPPPGASGPPPPR